MLGSERDDIVAWRFGSQRNDFMFERGWVRSGLLQFNGTALQQGLDSRQQDALRELLVREQIERRLFKPGPNSAFMRSAVSYLTLLTTSGMQHTTLRELSELLPEWIAGCARQLRANPDSSPAPGAMIHQCGNVVQFVYDAAARARSNGKDTVFESWRQLLVAAFVRGETGVDPVAFAGSSVDALRGSRTDDGKGLKEFAQ